MCEEFKGNKGNGKRSNNHARESASETNRHKDSLT